MKQLRKTCLAALCAAAMAVGMLTALPGHAEEDTSPVLPSGTTVQEINQLINNFENARSMMKQVSGKGKGKLKRMMRNMPQMPK